MVHALLRVHQTGLCHRDVKLENFLLDQATGTVKLTDFGFACFSPLPFDPFSQDPNHHKARLSSRASESVPLLSSFCGSVHYLAPEIARREPYRGQPADIWSLGVCLYAMATSRLPFLGPDQEAVFSAVQKGHVSYPPFLASTPLAELLPRLLDPSPASRISVSELARHPWVSSAMESRFSLPHGFFLAPHSSPSPLPQPDADLLRYLADQGMPLDWVSEQLGNDFPNAVKVYYRILHSRLCSDLSPVAPTGGRGSPRNDLVWPRGKGSSLLSPKKPEPLKRIASLPPNSMLDYTSKPFESPRGKSALMGSLKTIKSLLGEKRRNESPSSPRTVIFPSNLEDQLCVFMLPSQLSTD